MTKEELEAIPSITEYVGQSIVGEKVKIADVINKQMVITGSRVDESKYHDHKGENKCLTVQFQFADDELNTPHVLFTGSKVLLEKIPKSKYPCKATIVKVKNYYDVT